MPSNPLLYPDHPDWYADSTYSHDVARALIAAFAIIKRGARQAKSFLDAYAAVEPFMHASMSRQQRMHVSYVVSLSFAAMGNAAEALNWIDETLELALMLDDATAMIELLALRGEVNRGILHIRDAVDDFSDCLALLFEQEDRTGALDAAVALRILAQLGGFHFHLKHYETAQRLLDQARLLIPQAPGQILDAATVEWMQSHLHRWSGQPERALRPALAAAEVFTEYGTPASAARAQAAVAEIYLDFAEAVPDGSDRFGMLRQANAHLHLALALAREAHDSIGEALGLLCKARLNRLATRQENRMHLIDQVINTAERLDDIALRAQAHTSLGDELAASGSISQALNVYRGVIALLDGSDVPTLDMRARRALLQAEEQDGGGDVTA